MTMSPRALIFSDPNCPFCYATEERLFEIGLAGCVSWCGVQHAPELAVPMRSSFGSLSRELSAEVEAIRSFAPEVAIAAPPGKPNTRAAIEHGAAALRRDPTLGRGFVRSLYRAFWVDGTDLSDLTVLGALAEQAGLPGLDVGETAHEIADAWQAQWHQTGLAGVPVLVRDDGRALYGLRSADELHAFLS